MRIIVSDFVVQVLKTLSETELKDVLGIRTFGSRRRLRMRITAIAPAATPAGRPFVLRELLASPAPLTPQHTQKDCEQQVSEEQSAHAPLDEPTTEIEQGEPNQANSLIMTDTTQAQDQRTVDPAASVEGAGTLEGRHGDTDDADRSAKAGDFSTNSSKAIDATDNTDDIHKAADAAGAAEKAVGATDDTGKAAGAADAADKAVDAADDTGKAADAADAANKAVDVADDSSNVSADISVEAALQPDLQQKLDASDSGLAGSSEQPSSELEAAAAEIVLDDSDDDEVKEKSKDDAAVEKQMIAEGSCVGGWSRWFVCCIPNSDPRPWSKQVFTTIDCCFSYCASAPFHGWPTLTCFGCVICRKVPVGGSQAGQRPGDE